MFHFRLKINKLNLEGLRIQILFNITILLLTEYWLQGFRYVATELKIIFKNFTIQNKNSYWNQILREKSSHSIALGSIYSTYKYIQRWVLPTYPRIDCTRWNCISMIFEAQKMYKYVWLWNTTSDKLIQRKKYKL